MIKSNASSEPIEVIVRTGKDSELKLKVPWDADIYDWKDVFQVILKWLTFSDDTIRGLFKGKYEEN